jgi:beta-glucosidase
MVMADGPAGLRLSKDYFTDADGVHPIGGGSIPQSILDVLSAPLRKIVILLASGKRPKKGTEIKHQYCTALPIGTAIAQSWNVDLAEACGDIIGDEMGRFGVHLWLAPALNIHRSILCGRNFEYYSEDPLISGKIAAAITRGVQAYPGKGVTIKHFAANNCEYNRYFNNSVVSERALREIYLKGFRICIEEAGPLALMTSYNLINGIHSSESRPLTEGFLRAECGYEGIVMTDWVLDLKNHGTMFKKADAGRVAAAGGDLFMPGCQGDYDSVMDALKSGALTRSQMEINAERVRAMSAKLNAI